MNFAWKRELATDIPSLDAHHQGIFSRANAFFRKCQERGGTAELGALLDDLEEYTKKHFSFEEHLQQMNGYPGLPLQLASHELFITDLAALRTELEGHGPTQELVLIMKGKLIRWLFQHISNMDQEFAAFIKQKRH